MIIFQNSKPPIIIGGVQFGMNYGIANTKGKPLESDVFELLNYAEECGIEYIDTAKDYGDSEKVLHDFFLCHSASRLKVFSKFNTEKDLFEESCKERIALFPRNLFGILFHNASSLLDLEIGKKTKWASGELGISRFGVSVYEHEEFERACNTEWVSIIQAPFNVWDWGLLSKGLLQKAEDAGKIVILRSLLLQGALTLSPGEIDAKLPVARAYAEQWIEICQDKNKNLATAALEFGFAAANGCGFVLGCDSLAQLKCNIEIWLNRDADVYGEVLKNSMFQNVPEIVIKPYLWDSFPRK